ncbi:hypothetical protein EHQ68_10395 [Leptospira congkakensis]|uniref:Outer membrane protein beta-barrel domain-containing protein n=1 Tax=Leptospira congkakensis TaxID=2484932 RepID=A0A4Z1A334_9LEPT|nr:hypothetical protein [Leptospira congkakensis]TGL88226.1 hypothetical protein EHQ68_10395 [Leptospira congkakensis]TGL95331.1 hypothetical protein EHQ69_02580 [Leptospira congkakensis]TGL96412.1 hypothetical protein EHQ70_09630 [Leptospira congkakensis]
MNFSKQKQWIILIFFCFIAKDTFAEEIERKKTQILFTPWIIQSDKGNQNREIPSSFNLQILYSPFKNIYLGFIYGIGKGKDESYGQYYSNPNRTNAIYEFSRTKQGETFAFNIQYYIATSIFASLNLGLEKGFTVKRENYTNYSQNNTNLEPYLHNTSFSDRVFSSIGLGYKTEIWDYFLFALELQCGYIEAGRTNHNVTFNPNYYEGSLPKQYQDLLLSQSLNQSYPKNATFSQVLISAGLTF